MEGAQIYINVRLFQIRVEIIVHVVVLLPSCNKLQNFSAITSAWKGTRLTRMHV
jgi:hypothetical protein